MRKGLEISSGTGTLRQEIGSGRKSHESHSDDSRITGLPSEFRRMFTGHNDSRTAESR